MGQRLNIEICNNTETLANAYYHWSAYTSSALELTRRIIEAYNDMPKIENDLKLAVMLLQATGAGASEKEQERILLDGRFCGISFAEAVDRDNGLLAVTEEGMAETRDWAEGTVTINIEKKTFLFEVLYIDDEKGYKEEYGEDEFEKLNKLDMSKFLNNASFEDIQELIQIADANPDGVLLDDGTVISWIE